LHPSAKPDKSWFGAFFRGAATYSENIAERG